MQGTRSDFHFSGDDAHRFLPWIIGIMVAMATLLLCLGITLGGWIIERHSNYSNRFTVNIPADTANLNSKVTEIQNALLDIPGINSVERVSEEELKTLLATWLGSAESVGELPLPVVLDVTMDDEAIEGMDYDSLEKTLALMVPRIEVDAHERWVAAFAQFSATAQYVLTLLSALIIGSIAVMIAFTSRASLKLHARTVYLLHAIGAEDEYITRQFQKEACKLALPGAFLGGAFAGILYWAIGMYIASLPHAGLPSLTLTNAHMALMVIMPLACALVAWLVARVSVVKQLQATL